MPELPEVECLTRAVRGVLEGGRLERATFLRPDLRDPIPIEAFRAMLEGERVDEVFRRSKYMLLKSRKGYGVFHLGMTGALLEQPSIEPAALHTHAVFVITDPKGRERYLHYIDPRRFGRIDCIEGDDYSAHVYFAELGPEPLDHKSLGKYLFEASRKRAQPIKCFLMDGRIVVGVGNIYASESLFRAGISPLRKAGTVSRQRYEALGEEIKTTLLASIKAGGTTFRDFRNSDGKPGYFAVSLNVYGREGETCGRCGGIIQQIRQAGRSTFYCGGCQT